MEESIEGNDTIEEDKDEVDDPLHNSKAVMKGHNNNNMSHMLENLSSIEEAAPAAHLDSLSEVLPAPTTAVVTASTESESESVCGQNWKQSQRQCQCLATPEAVSGYLQPQEVVLEEDKDTVIVRTAEEEEDDDPFAGL